MTDKITPEKRAEYKKNEKRRRRYLDVMQLKSTKEIEIQYQGCACRDRMSKVLFDHFKDTDFPVGTRIWVGDRSWEIR
jgi:hypothetical protein